MLNPAFAYLALVFLAFVVIGFYVWAYMTYSTLKTCEQSESPLCPLQYCDTTTTTCGNFPFRPDPTTGAPICASYLLTKSAPTAGTNLG